MCYGYYDERELKEMASREASKESSQNKAQNAQPKGSDDVQVEVGGGESGRSRTTQTGR